MLHPRSHYTSIKLAGGSNKKGIIGGVVGGAGALVLLLIVGLFVWFKQSKKSQAGARGNVIIFFLQIYLLFG